MPKTEEKLRNDPGAKLPGREAAAYYAHESKEAQRRINDAEEYITTCGTRTSNFCWGACIGVTAILGGVALYYSNVFNNIPEDDVDKDRVTAIATGVVAVVYGVVSGVTSKLKRNQENDIIKERINPTVTWGNHARNSHTSILGGNKSLAYNYGQNNEALRKIGALEEVEAVPVESRYIQSKSRDSVIDIQEKDPNSQSEQRSSRCVLM